MISDGLIVVAKRNCPTCVLVEEVFKQLEQSDMEVEIVSQDDPDFPANVETVVDDRELEHSFRLGIEIVPTLVRMEGGREVFPGTCA